MSDGNSDSEAHRRTQPPAGFYQAPDGNGQRWWDGLAWTEHRTERTATPPPPVNAFVTPTPSATVSAKGAEEPANSSDGHRGESIPQPKKFKHPYVVGIVGPLAIVAFIALSVGLIPNVESTPALTRASLIADFYIPAQAVSALSNQDFAYLAGLATDNQLALVGQDRTRAVQATLEIPKTICAAYNHGQTDSYIRSESFLGYTSQHFRDTQIKWATKIYCPEFSGH